MTKGLLSTFFGIVSFFFLQFIIAPLAIVFGLSSIKGGGTKIAWVGVILGTISLLFLFPGFKSIDPIITVYHNVMEHDGNFEYWWEADGREYAESNIKPKSIIYGELGIAKQQFKSFPFTDGITTGDALIVSRADYHNLKVGDVIIGWINSVDDLTVTRVIEISTKPGGKRYIQILGDQYNYGYGVPQLLQKDQIKYRVLAKIPKIGWPNLILSEFLSFGVPW